MDTFLVNIIDCFFIVLLFGLPENAKFMTPQENVFLITVFCGVLTTLSSFADDKWLLDQKGDWLIFGVYLGLSVVLSVLCIWAGRAIIR